MAIKEELLETYQDRDHSTNVEDIITYRENARHDLSPQRVLVLIEESTHTHTHLKIGHDTC